MLTVEPTIKIVATILAKDEEDIIGTTIEHHIAQGVKHFIITDNQSSDKTREIVASYPEVVEIIDEPGDTHHQSVWVSRMAQIACQLKPDWIIHLDADELWTGLQGLRRVRAPVAACEGMYLHPPTGDTFDLLGQRWYINVDHVPLPQETKVAHRPDPNIVIAHGNHAVENATKVEIIKNISRHHYPIRTYEQWSKKAMKHLNLEKRNSICKRWENWYHMLQHNELESKYANLVSCWKKLIQGSNDPADFLETLSLWCTPEVLTYFDEHRIMPKIGEWPCEAKLS